MVDRIIRTIKLPQPVTTAADVVRESQQSAFAKGYADKAASELTTGVKPPFGSFSNNNTTIPNATPGKVSLSGIAQGAISGLSGVALPTPAAGLISGVPTASNMRGIAKTAETAAQAEIDTVIYNTYKASIFDPIVALAQAGQYVYDVQLDATQQNQLTPLLIKNGYKLIDIVNSARYNLRISWATGTDTTPINGGG